MNIQGKYIFNGCQPDQAVTPWDKVFEVITKLDSLRQGYVPNQKREAKIGTINSAG